MYSTLLNTIRDCEIGTYILIKKLTTCVKMVIITSKSITTKLCLPLWTELYGIRHDFTFQKKLSNERKRLEQKKKQI